MDVRRLAIGSVALAFIALDPALGARGPEAQTRETAADAAIGRGESSSSFMSAKLSNPDLADPTAANAVTACDLSSRAAFLGEPDIPERREFST